MKYLLVFLALVFVVNRCSQKSIDQVIVEKNFDYRLYQIDVHNAHDDIEQDSYQVAKVNANGPLYSDGIQMGFSNKSCHDCEYGVMKNGEMVLAGYGSIFLYADQLQKLKFEKLKVYHDESAELLRVKGHTYPALN